jgi:hypothetical protein
MPDQRNIATEQPSSLEEAEATRIVDLDHRALGPMNRMQPLAEPFRFASESIGVTLTVMPINLNDSINIGAFSGRLSGSSHESMTPVCVGASGGTISSMIFSPESLIASSIDSYRPSYEMTSLIHG